MRTTDTKQQSLTTFIKYLKNIFFSKTLFCVGTNLEDERNLDPEYTASVRLFRPSLRRLKKIKRIKHLGSYDRGIPIYTIEWHPQLKTSQKDYICLGRILRADLRIGLTIGRLKFLTRVRWAQIYLLPFWKWLIISFETVGGVMSNVNWLD